MAEKYKACNIQDIQCVNAHHPEKCLVGEAHVVINSRQYAEYETYEHHHKPVVNTANKHRHMIVFSVFNTCINSIYSLDSVINEVTNVNSDDEQSASAVIRHWL